MAEAEWTDYAEQEGDLTFEEGDTHQSEEEEREIEEEEGFIEEIEDKPAYEDLQRVSSLATRRLGTTIKGYQGAGVALAQNRAKTPIERFEDRFVVEFRNYDDNAQRAETAKLMFEKVPRAEFLSPTYAAAAVIYVERKNKKLEGQKYEKLGPAERKSLETFALAHNLNIIDMIRYIRIIENAM